MFLNLFHCTKEEEICCRQQPIELQVQVGSSRIYTLLYYDIQLKLGGQRGHGDCPPGGKARTWLRRDDHWFH